MTFPTRLALALLLASCFGLGASKCADKFKSGGDDIVESAREAHDKTIEDTGGWAGRQLDNTQGRLDNSVGKGFDRLEQAGTEE